MANQDDGISLSTFRKLSTFVYLEVEPDDKAKPGISLWEQICNETEEKRQLYDEMKAAKLPQQIPNVEVEYIRTEIFPILIPALESMLIKAKEWNCLYVQKCYFNGVDHLVEYLWNMNPKYPERAEDWKEKFKIPWVIEYLKEHPRPFYPLSWIMSKDYAALVIQRNVRAYWERRDKDIQELRTFWKDLVIDDEADEDLKKAEEQALIDAREQRERSKICRQKARERMLQFIEDAREARRQAREQRKAEELEESEKCAIARRIREEDRLEREAEFTLARQEQEALKREQERIRSRIQMALDESSNSSSGCSQYTNPKIVPSKPHVTF